MSDRAVTVVVERFAHNAGPVVIKVQRAQLSTRLGRVLVATVTLDHD